MSLPLAGRVALITGASKGLGLAIARAYVENGATVALCARDTHALSETKDLLVPLLKGGQEAYTDFADVSDPASVAAWVGTQLQRFPQIHILVNNAGIYGPKGAIEEIDWAEWKHALEINLFGSVLTSKEILPHFRQKRYGKIVQLSGGGATNPMPRLTAYAASKAAVVRFAESLALEVKGTGIDVNCIAPGALNTQMLDEAIAAGPKKLGLEFYNRMLKQKREGGSDPKIAADLAVFLGSASSDGISGRLISAVWDNWKELPVHREELAPSDIFTLRRIVPKDRGQSWT